MHDEVSGNHEHGMHHMSQACGCDDGWIIGAATSGIWLWPWRGGGVKAVAQQLSCCGCRIRYSAGATNSEGQFEAGVKWGDWYTGEAGSCVVPRLHCSLRNAVSGTCAENVWRARACGTQVVTVCDSGACRCHLDLTLSTKIPVSSWSSYWAASTGDTFRSTPPPGSCQCAGFVRRGSSRTRPRTNRIPRPACHARTNARSTAADICLTRWQLGVSGTPQSFKRALAGSFGAQSNLPMFTRNATASSAR